MHYIEDALLEMLKEKPLDKTSVKEVAEKAHVSRQTVYYHYDSLLDVFTSWFNESIWSRFTNSRERNWVAGFEDALRFCVEYKTEIINVYRSSYHMDFIRSQSQYAIKMLTDDIDILCKELEIPLSDRDKEFVVNYYVKLAIGVILNFIDDEMEDDPGYLASRLEIMVANSFEEKARKMLASYSVD